VYQPRSSTEIDYSHAVLADAASLAGFTLLRFGERKSNLLLEDVHQPQTILEFFKHKNGDGTPMLQVGQRKYTSVSC
jgi:hypothetical protein